MLQVLLALHILAAVVFVGNIITATFYLELNFRRARRPKAAWLRRPA